MDDSTVMGRPLQLSVPIHPDDAAFGNGAACANAEVMYGDQPVASSSIRVDVSADGRVARIFSSALVDEPFVTVLLHPGCGTRATRRYVALAQAPLEGPMVLEAATSPGLAAGGAAPSAVLLPAGPAGAAVPARPAATRNPNPDGDRRPAARSMGRAAGPQLPAAGRLQLAVWEPGAEGGSWLRASTQLVSLPDADGAQRAAAAALWRALNAQPQDLLRTAGRLGELEGDVASLRGLAARHRGEIPWVRESLLETRSQRYTNLALVIGLALLAGGGAAVLWHPSRRATAQAPFASGYSPVEPHLEPLPVEEQLAARVVSPTPQVPPALAPIHPVLVPQPTVPAAMVPTDFFFGELPAAVEAAGVDDAPIRLKVEALHDAQQQSEFFASLGQFDEAIAAVTGYLAESPDQPVLAYMELFRIYHGLERRDEYARLQSNFRTLFGIDFAGMDDYRDERRELELYPVAVSRIAACWPTEASLELIEQLLFKRPSAARELLSLDAYRELIWLYILGQDIVHNPHPAGLQLVGGADLPNDHFILSCPFDNDEEPQELSLDRLGAIEVAPQIRGFAVDMDLTAPPLEPLRQGRSAGRMARDQAWDDSAPARLPAVDSGLEDSFDSVMEFHSHKNSR